MTCPVCGKTIHLSEYEKVMKNIRQAVFRGWTCRIEYEHEDDDRRYYTEQCGEILNFVALAIASGIIGNLSTDVVKKVFSKIGSYLRQSKKNHEDDVVTSFLESSENEKKECDKMWTLILCAILLGAIIGIIYLASRFARFSIIRKAAKERKGICFLIGLILVILLLLGIWLTLGFINAAICIIHLMVIWLLCDVISKFAEKKRQNEFTRYYAGVAAIGITFIYLTCGWVLAHHVWSKKYILETDKKVGNLRIVQFADSHVGTTFGGEGFAKQVKRMQSENPDIVVITGDYVDDDTTKEDMIASCAALGTLKTTYGVYYAFGNHDKGYYGPQYRGYSGDDLIAELEKNNVKVLQDETVLLDNRFYLIGRQDRSEDQRGNSPRASMEELTANLDTDKYSIVLDHQPHDYAAQTESGVDLVLSGHTHGGQLFPFNRMGQWTGIDDKSYGLEKRENTNFIVTSGISDWAIKFKTGCKSEYVVVDIQGA